MFSTGLPDVELSIGIGLFGSGLDFEKLSGFNRAGRQSKIEESDNRVFF